MRTGTPPTTWTQTTCLPCGEGLFGQLSDRLSPAPTRLYPGLLPEANVAVVPTTFRGTQSRPCSSPRRARPHDRPPRHPLCGHPNRLHATVPNRGDAPARNVRVRFLAPNPGPVYLGRPPLLLVGTATAEDFPHLEELAPGRSATVSVTWVPRPSGAPDPHRTSSSRRSPSRCPPRPARS